MQNNLEVMRTFTLKNIPNLDVCVLGALELFAREKIPRMKIPYKHPLVVGSGNAEVTGRILFHDKDCVFASESDVKEKLKKIKSIDGVVLISASGPQAILSPTLNPSGASINLFSPSEYSIVASGVECPGQWIKSFTFPVKVISPTILCLTSPLYRNEGAL